ncbi:MAG: S1 RNA-binding domain-containing protein [Candidatus Aenigmarchaeota archaeon]|nr:S1 RNA-binding domain-containing protein [Candidatus Aenigmarchaeota archaeon]
MELLKKERDVVIPGDIIVESMEFLPGRNTFRENEAILSKRVGLVSINGRAISVVPLSGAYIPREGDMVIGKVTDIQNNGWVVDVHAPSDAFLPLAGVKEYIDTRKTSLNRYYDVGDIIYAKVNGLQGTSIYLSMQDIKARKFHGGRLVRISPTKVPRLIGKQGSMINIIKDGTGCKINAGQNGLIWLEGEGMEKCIEVIGLIEREAAAEGLTDKISAMLGVTIDKSQESQEVLE